jgi:hypothetical protein
MIYSGGWPPGWGVGGDSGALWGVKSGALGKRPNPIGPARCSPSTPHAPARDSRRFASNRDLAFVASSSSTSPRAIRNRSSPGTSGRLQMPTSTRRTARYASTTSTDRSSRSGGFSSCLCTSSGKPSSARSRCSSGGLTTSAASSTSRTTGSWGNGHRWLPISPSNLRARKRRTRQYFDRDGRHEAVVGQPHQPRDGRRCGDPRGDEGPSPRMNSSREAAGRRGDGGTGEPVPSTEETAPHRPGRRRLLPGRHRPRLRGVGASQCRLRGSRASMQSWTPAAGALPCCTWPGKRSAWGAPHKGGRAAGRGDAGRRLRVVAVVRPGHPRRARSRTEDGRRREDSQTPIHGIPVRPPDGRAAVFQNGGTTWTPELRPRTPSAWTGPSVRTATASA